MKEELNKIETFIEKILWNEDLSSFTIGFLDNFQNTYFTSKLAEVSVEEFKKRVEFINDILEIIDSERMVDFKVFHELKRLLNDYIKS